jgi:hypothetical protein
MKLWRVEIVSKDTRSDKQEGEYAFIPAPSLEAAIDHAKWVDSFCPPIEPYLSTVRQYGGRKATPLERESYHSEIEAEANR